MSLLFSIFPGLIDWGKGGIPEWVGESEPWQILGNYENSLESQIMKFLEQKIL